MKAIDAAVLIVFAVAGYVIWKKLATAPGEARTWYAADQDDRDIGNAMRANRETVAGAARPPSGAVWDPMQGAWTLNGMIYT